MKQYIAIFIIIMLPFFAAAQTNTDANLTGHVVHAKTDEHLPYVTVLVKGTTIATTTDATGHFFLKNLPLGRHIIEVTMVGFKSQSKAIDIEPNKLYELNFEIDEDVFELDGAVVTTNRIEQARQKSPNLVALIPATTFANTNSTTLGQGICFQPGLRLETNCQNCGTQQIRINGLDGPYSQMLIDGRAVMSSLTSVYGVEQIPANMIERVEVIRGGGTAVSGASAIGGTINVITKEPLRNSAALSNTTTLIGGKSADFNTSLNASLVTDDYKAGVYVFGNVRNRDSYDADDDGFSEIGKLEGKTIGFRSYYRPTNYTRLTLEYHNMGEYRRGGDSLNLPPHKANIAEQLEHEINGGGLKFDILSKDYKRKLNVYTSAQHAKRKSYFGTSQSLDGYGRTTDKVLLAGAQLTQSFDRLWFMPSELNVGAEYNYNDLNDKVLERDPLDQTIRLASAYLQNEWKNDKLSFLIGVRADKHNLLSDPVISPRANIRYNINETVIFRGTYSEGFRAPQAYNEDLHVSFANGEPRVIYLSPDLKEERSRSFSLSADFYKDFGRVKTNLLVEGFYTRLNDVFVLEDKGEDADGTLLQERRNGGSAEVKGVNIEAKVAPNAKLEFQGGFTFQSSRYGDAQKWSDDEDVPYEKRMFRSPDTYGYIMATYAPVKPLLVSLSGTYTGSMLVQHVGGLTVRDGSGNPVLNEDGEVQKTDIAVNTPSFFDLGLKVAYDFALTKSLTLQLNAGIQNMFNAYQDDFDKGVDRDANYIYGPSLPRSYNIGCKISF